MGWQWHQLDHMQIICTTLQTDNHASTPSLNFLRMLLLMLNQQCQLCNTVGISNSSQYKSVQWLHICVIGIFHSTCVYRCRMAPEVIMCETVKDSPYNYKADIWSFGQFVRYIYICSFIVEAFLSLLWCRWLPSEKHRLFHKLQWFTFSWHGLLWHILTVQR